MHEVKYEWDIDELLDAHEVLEIKAEKEKHALEQARRKK